jgi:hypothetical protein
MFKLSPPVISPRDPGSQRWNWTLLFLDVPSFTTGRLPRDPSIQRWDYMGEKWPMNFAWNARLSRSVQGSFTCRKSTTWDRWLYFPSEGRRAEDFFALKNPTASAGFEPANLGTKGQHAMYRPPKLSLQHSWFCRRFPQWDVGWIMNLQLCGNDTSALGYHCVVKERLLCIDTGTVSANFWLHCLSIF